MTAEARLVEVVGKLEAAGVQTLVLGGHAVRHYGIDRNTIDFDLVVGLGADAWASLSETITAILPGSTEGSSWRPDDFRRFIIGTLPDGRDERLEFWLHNHLLAPFAELRTRAEEGTYGGATLRFVGLDDLIRSKETEREDDWRDVALLEEIADDRRRGDHVAMLRHLRSRRGFEQIRPHIDAALIARATTEPLHPLAAAFVAPAAASVPRVSPTLEGLDTLLGGPLGSVTLGSARHLALVEAVRRMYRARAMKADRDDKERVISGR